MRGFLEYNRSENFLTGRGHVVRATIMLIIISSMLVGCNTKYDTLNQAIKEEVSYNIIDVIHVEEVHNNESVALFLTKPKDRRFKALGTAFFIGSDNNKWEYAPGSAQWEYSSDENLEVYYRTYHLSDNESKVKLTYGRINNQDIESIEVANEDKEYIEVDIIETTTGRYFLNLGDYPYIRSFAEDGQIISTHGK
jgi:hypothetical protein